MLKLREEVTLDIWNEELYVQREDKHLPDRVLYEGTRRFNGVQHKVFVIYKNAANKTITLSHEQFTKLFSIEFSLLLSQEVK